MWSYRAITTGPWVGKEKTSPPGGLEVCGGLYKKSLPGPRTRQPILEDKKEAE